MVNPLWISMFFHSIMLASAGVFGTLMYSMVLVGVQGLTLGLSCKDLKWTELLSPLVSYSSACLIAGFCLWVREFRSRKIFLLKRHLTRKRRNGEETSNDTDVGRYEKVMIEPKVHKVRGVCETNVGEKKAEILSTALQTEDELKLADPDSSHKQGTESRQKMDIHLLNRNELLQLPVLLPDENISAEVLYTTLKFKGRASSHASTLDRANDSQNVLNLRQNHTFSLPKSNTVITAILPSMFFNNTTNSNKNKDKKTRKLQTFPDAELESQYIHTINRRFLLNIRIKFFIAFLLGVLHPFLDVVSYCNPKMIYVSGN
jgi:hypothetical protein